MRTSHVARSYGCRWLVAGALCGLSLNVLAAINGGSAPRANNNQNGRSAAIGPLTNSGGSTIPVSPNLGGWTQAGNYGVPPSAAPGSTMNMGMNGDVYFAGQRYPFQAAYGTPWKDLAKNALQVGGSMGCALIPGIGIVAGAACTAGMSMALPFIAAWLTKAGGRVNPDSKAIERADPTVCSVAPCFKYRHQGLSGQPTYPFRYLKADACEDFASYLRPFNTSSILRAELRANGTCDVFVKPKSGGAETLGWGAGGYDQQSTPAIPANWLPSSMDDIAPYMGLYNPDSRVVGEILGNGGTLPDAVPTVTGPSLIQGPETVKQNSDGTKEISRTNYNFTTAGNTITNTTNITTTNNYNAAGAVTNTTTTTTTPTTNTSPGTTPQEPQPTQCEKFPQTLGCAEGDIPEGQIPKQEKTLTFSVETPFGGGSCPADRMFTSFMTGRTYKAWDFAQTCSYIASYVRPLVLLLATFAAFLIIMPGKVET